ncbi:MAG: hypothetical protein HY874_09230 [Chloroflexi bacterium]|nr:hypothetical protein [Chloroflexota bacterium]
MNRRDLTEIIRHGEEGHGMTLIGPIIGGAGAIALAIGAANDTGVLAIVGGIVLAVGLVGMLVGQHMVIDYDVYDRLNKLEKK